MQLQLYEDERLEWLMKIDWWTYLGQRSEVLDPGGEEGDGEEADEGVGGGVRGRGHRGVIVDSFVLSQLHWCQDQSGVNDLESEQESSQRQFNHALDPHLHIFEVRITESNQQNLNCCIVSALFNPGV